jgi:D-alanyl-D-alanine carboxypeptidase/D-alanyl-D-alanine-endopeptidase (penicillin-binding protein 4)
MLVALALALVCAAQAARAGHGELQQAVEAVCCAPARRHARIGVHVVDAATGEPLYARLSGGLYIPASNQKIATAAAALKALGPHYAFRTRIYALGRLQGAVLDGDLLVRGGGDPTIGGRYDQEDASQVLERWARVLAAGGLRRVRGSLIVDDRFFGREHRPAAWGRYTQWKWHFTASGALSINDNCVTVDVRPGAQAGDPAQVTLLPPGAPLATRVACTTHGSRHAIWFERREATVVVGGHIRRGTQRYAGPVTVPDPAAFAAGLLEHALRARGIELEGGARSVRKGDPPVPADARPLFVREAALVPVLGVMLRESHNHFAEQVFRTLGAEKAGDGSWAGGARAVGKALQELGLRAEEFTAADGSGLSRQNRLTPRALTRLLVAVRRAPWGEGFAQMLALAGESGTLDGRLQSAPYRNNVQAKTGYIKGVGALSGYARTRSGRDVAFSILVNDDHAGYSMRQTVDAICRAIVDHAP